ncbi:MAG TPA: endonuclease/exonuclease/phosphatase family protein [Polyangiaceae bacterium]|nr:endonuclease/exonuclease/phosphatase family protein [Polyangiaceae bacterium]
MTRAHWATLRILTWNIHKGIGGVDRRYDPWRIIALLEHYSPDVALLQEVSEGLPQANHHNQAQMLAETLGMGHWAYHPEHQFKVGGYGNLILSKWPLSQVEHVDLTIGGRKKRGLLKARVHFKEDAQSRSLVVYNMHLGLAGSERGEQLKRFLQCQPFAHVHHNTPLVVGGDLNDLWGTLGPRFLQPQGLVRLGRLANTFPAAFPLRPLDGLFARGDVRLQHWQVPRMELAATASDHRPILADLELRVG